MLKRLFFVAIYILLTQSDLFSQKNPCFSHANFSICYPQTFTKKETKSAFFVSDANGSSIIVNINKDKPDPSLTPWDLTQEILEAITKPSYPSYKILKMEKVYINSHKGLIVHSQIGNVKQMSLFISNAEHGFVVTCTAKLFFEVYQKAFLTSIQSFKIS